MPTKKQTCSSCGHKQTIKSSNDLDFEICQGCAEMGQWGQSTAQAVEPEIVQNNDLLLPVEITEMPVVDIFAPYNMEKIILALEVKAKGFVPDTTTAKGRKEIASFSAKFSRSKVFLDDKGKELVSEWKEKAKVIDSERKKYRDTCDMLRDKSRQPLTDWENAEKDRIAAEQLAADIERDHVDALAENDLFNRQKEIERKELEFAKIEEEKRQAEEAQRQKDEEARIAKETAEREKRIAEEARLAAEEEAKKQIAEAKSREIAAEKERIAAEERAKHEKIEADARAKIEQAAAVRKAELAAKEEADRLEAARLAKIEEERIANEKRIANKKHRDKINSEAIRFIKGINGITKGQAEDVISAIANGDVPHVTINY